MDLEPSRPRTYWTNWSSAGDLSSDRSPGHRDGGTESHAAETVWCDIGLGLGTTGQGEEEPCSRGGADDDDTAKDGRSEGRDGIGGQSSQRGQASGCPRHSDLRRRRGSGTGVARMQPQQQTLDPAAREALARMSDAPTSMRAMQQAQQQEPTPPMTPTVTQGTEPLQELQVTQEAVLREAMRQAENTAVGQSPQGSRTLLSPTGAGQLGRGGGAQYLTGNPGTGRGSPLRAQGVPLGTDAESSSSIARPLYLEGPR